MLIVSNLSTGYSNKQILFDVSFEIKKKDIVLVIGSNGSGKSTLLKAISGVLPQWNESKIIFNGEDITGKDTSILLKKGLLYIPQKNNLFEDLTVKENLEMAGLILEKHQFKQRMENSLSIFSILVPHLNRISMKLSGGERQLLTLAMATLHEPKMILIDEPFTGLSPQNVNFLTENLKVLNKELDVTLLLVEHHVKESLQFSDKIIGMKLGSISLEMNINSFFNPDILNSIFV